jgi:hypothetical protein
MSPTAMDASLGPGDEENSPSLDPVPQELQASIDLPAAP